MSFDDRRKSTDRNYAGEERRGKRQSVFPSLGGFGSRKSPAQDAEDTMIDNAGMPSVGRRKGNSKLVNIIGVVVIIGFGVAMAMAVNGDKSKAPKKKKDAPESIANNLPPLVVPAAPPRPVVAAASAPVMTPTAMPGVGNGARGGVAPIALQGIGSPTGALGSNGKAPLTWQDRKMGGVTLVSSGGGSSAGDSLAARADALKAQILQAQGGDDAPRSSQGQGGTLGGGRGELAAKLEPTVMKGASASLLPDRNYVIAKGTSLDCALETALDSTTPGITTCRLTRDVYSDNGQVVLLDRGTQLVGEYQGGIKQGQARLFVLWTRAKTPNGVIVSLNSPGADALGRSGLEGWVDTHFIDRFGAAIMISMLKDTYAYLIARESRSGGQNNFVLGNTAQGTDKMAEKALEASVNIPPTLMKNQGDHIQVMLARDLDFSGVYALRSGQ